MSENRLVVWGKNTYQNWNQHQREDLHSLFPDTSRLNSQLETFTLPGGFRMELQMYGEASLRSQHVRDTAHSARSAPGQPSRHLCAE